MKQLFYAILLTSTPLVLACGSANAMRMSNSNNQENMMSKNLVDIVIGNPDFSTLLAAVKAAGLVDTLKDGEFTVFAPTNEAFAALPAGTVEALLKDVPKLKKILLYHVVPGTVLAKDVVNLTEAKTAEGGEVTVEVEDGKVFINDAEVIKPDVKASNGVVHVINKVLMP